MAIIAHSVLLSSSCRCVPRLRLSVSGAVASMDSGGSELNRSKFLEFPHASAAQRNMMLGLISSVDNRLGSSLQGCTLPHDVQHFSAGPASASLQLRPGIPSSQIDFILESWIHCKLPSDGALNIISLSAYLKSSTNAPHLVVELIQSTPTSLVFIIDLTPRKDLVSYPDYLKAYYQETNLDKYRQQLQALPGVKPYISPYLYFRALVSPTAIVVNIDAATGEAGNIEEIIQAHVEPIAKEILQIWMETCACPDGNTDEVERAYLVERDRILRKNTVDVELGSSLPKLFGQELANRAIEALKKYYYG